MRYVARSRVQHNHEQRCRYRRPGGHASKQCQCRHDEEAAAHTDEPGQGTDAESMNAPAASCLTTLAQGCRLRFRHSAGSDRAPPP